MRRRLTVSPPLPPAAWPARAPRPLPWPLEEAATRTFAWGRVALWHGVRALGLGAGDTVLVPAYHHGSEVEALLRARLRVRFYEGGPDLVPREDELEALLDGTVRALHLIHYLGWPQDAARWRRWCDARGLLLLEDAAQAWLASRDGAPAGSHGDLALFCLYKSVPLPEGALLWCPSAPPAAPPPDPRAGVAVLARRHAAWLAQRFAPAGEAAIRLRAPERYCARRDFALRDPWAGVWSAQARLLPRLLAVDVAGRRRANARRLAAALGERVPEPFRAIPDGAAPFVLPVEVGDAGAWAEALRTQGIVASDFWSTPHPEAGRGRFASVERRRGRTLGLPVHQYLEEADLDAIAGAVLSRPTG